MSIYRTILLFFLVIPIVAFSQTVEKKIQIYLDGGINKRTILNNDNQDWIIKGKAESHATGINNYYIQQRHKGISIHNAISNVWMQNGEVVEVINKFVSNVANKVNRTKPNLGVLEALSKAIQLLAIPNNGPFSIIESIDQQKFIVSNGTITDSPIPAELVYEQTDSNKLRLAWDFTIYTQGYPHVWSLRIDAIEGTILSKHDKNISCSFKKDYHVTEQDLSLSFTKTFFKDLKSLSYPTTGSYRVLPFSIESPNHGTRTLITSPEDAIASPFGWHDSDGIVGAEYTYTRGNNVLAQEDLDGLDGIGQRPDGTTDLQFDFTYNGSGSTPSTYLDAATTNLFYMNNIMHDVWFHYGFDEANGNFQQKNYSGVVQQGSTGDAVLADSQDGYLASSPKLNNANFYTPADGFRPRMQMYMWNTMPFEPLSVNSPSDLAGPKRALDNVFNPGHVSIPSAPSVITSDLVLFNDGVSETADACSAAVNSAAINGHIVIIKRGTCSFIKKVKYAQEAGALAVIITNSFLGDLLMNGADASIRIPAIGITKELGDILISRMNTEKVNVKIQIPASNFIAADSDFDNKIIAHEYGHGISNRLTGGPLNANCLDNEEQAGEGWSDWFSLMMMIQNGDNGEAPKTIGTFVLNETTTGAGVRQYPYSTDMLINPKTFSSSNVLASHARGEFMAVVLWDLTWAFINKYGFDSNIYTGTGGNNKVMRLVIDALKLQGCSPTFIDFRDALLRADDAITGDALVPNSGLNNCIIKEVFRRRGMGLNASSGLATSALDQVEDFTPFVEGSNCSTMGIDYFKEKEMFKVYPNPSNGLVHLHINQFIGIVTIQVFDCNGRVVFTLPKEAFDIDKRIDLSRLQKGIYLLKVNNEALNYTQKLILK